MRHRGPHRGDVGRQGMRRWFRAHSLHGLGFAGALAEVGLPHGEIPLALFSFNVGIELGELAFVAVVLTAVAALEKLPRRWPAWTADLPAYGIGSLAIYWLLERVTAMAGFGS